MSDKIERVAIIGSGIGGLSLAACINHFKAGVKEVLLFDAHPDVLRYDIGGVLALSGGAFILKELGCFNDLQKYACRVDKLVISHGTETLVDLHFGTLSNDKNNVNGKVTGKEGAPLMYSARWVHLRQVLVNAAFGAKAENQSNVIPEIKHPTAATTKINVVSKKRLIGLTEDPVNGNMTVLFADGSEYSDFDLVIGADGWKSTARDFARHKAETILASIPFVGRCAQAYCTTIGTGISVLQSVAPAKQQVAEDVQCKGLLQEWVGNGANFYTMKLGEHQEDLKLTIRTSDDLLPEQVAADDHLNEDMVTKHAAKSAIIIRKAGFTEDHELHRVLKSVCCKGSLMFDLKPTGSLWPLRSWSSESGRLILIGDSAHYVSPFLRQGPDQAISDAFCLAGMIYEHNYGLPLPAVERVKQAGTKSAPSSFIELVMMIMLMAAKFVFDMLCMDHLKMYPTSMQRLAHRFEQKRKFRTWIVTLMSRATGVLETMGGRFGVVVKMVIYRFLNRTGLIKLVYTVPMRPVV